MAEGTQVGIRIGGRSFAAANLQVITAWQEAYIGKVISESGLDKCLPAIGATPAQDEVTADFISRFSAAMIMSGKTCEVLGAHLLPIGVTEDQWTPEVAEEVTNYIRRQNSQQSRDEIRSLVGGFVMDFFRRELLSLQSSLSSLSETKGKGRSSTAGRFN